MQIESEVVLFSVGAISMSKKSSNVQNSVQVKGQISFKELKTAPLTRSIDDTVGTTNCCSCGFRAIQVPGGGQRSDVCRQ